MKLILPLVQLHIISIKGSVSEAANPIAEIDVPTFFIQFKIYRKVAMTEYEEVEVFLLQNFLAEKN